MGFNTTTITFDAVADMKSYTTASSNERATLLGYYAPGDHGGGEFYWDSASTLTPDNGLTFQVTGVSTGRWRRLYSTAIDVRWFGAKGDNTTDDTTVINAAIASISTGEIIFGQNSTYLISATLTVNNPLTINLNGATIQFASSVSTTNVAAFTMGSDNVTIRNGIIQGTFVPGTDTPTPGIGPYGVSNNSGKANMSVDRLTIQNVQSYGIISSDSTNVRITNSRFINTGYICLYIDISTSGKEAGMVVGNTFDRSGLQTSYINNPNVSIRGNATGPVYLTNLIFTDNKVISKQSPSTGTAACMEVRYLSNSTLDNNIYVAGTIGLSMVTCNELAVSANYCYNCSNEGMEIGTSTYCVLDGNVIDGGGLAASQGILVDGTPASSTYAIYNTISNNIIRNVGSSCIQIDKGCDNNNIVGGTLSQSNTGKVCIGVQGAQYTRISEVMMNGNGSASWGIQVDNVLYPAYNDVGTIIQDCLFMNFALSAINVYAPNGGAISGLRVIGNTLNSGSMITFNLTGATVPSPYYYNNSPEIVGSKVIVAGNVTNASAGTATLASGTAMVSNTLVTSNSVILLSVSTPGGTQGILSYAVSAGASFTIKSTSATESSIVSWLIVN